MKCDTRSTTHHTSNPNNAHTTSKPVQTYKRCVHCVQAYGRLKSWA